jgi:hypothetical protein
MSAGFDPPALWHFDAPRRTEPEREAVVRLAPRTTTRSSASPRTPPPSTISRQSSRDGARHVDGLCRPEGRRRARRPGRVSRNVALSGGTGGLLRRTTRITSSLSAFTARTDHAVSARLRARNPLMAPFKRQGGERPQGRRAKLRGLGTLFNAGKSSAGQESCKPTSTLRGIRARINSRPSCQQSAKGAT